MSQHGGNQWVNRSHDSDGKRKRILETMAGERLGQGCPRRLSDAASSQHPICISCGECYYEKIVVIASLGDHLGRLGG